MIVFVFEVFAIALILLNYYMHKRKITIISAFIIPYLFIIPINNYIATKFGFHSINDDVVLMIFFTMMLLTTGVIIDNMLFRTKSVISQKTYVLYLQKCKIRKMLKYVLFCEAIAFIRLIVLIHLYGISYLSGEDGEGVFLSGVVGHLFLTAYNLVPILFVYWLNNKSEKIFLYTVVFALILIFFTFVKYHLFGMIIMLVFAASIANEKNIVKSSILFSLLILSLFVVNYIVGFFYSNVLSKVDRNFYATHFWSYIAGSLIRDNRIFIGISSNAQITVLYRLISCLVAPINVFLLKFFDIAIFAYAGLGEYKVSSTGEMGNILDAIGYLFPYNDEAFEYIVFGSMMIFIGFIFEHIYMKEFRQVYFPSTLIVLLTFFISLSFYGNFYIKLIPWELLVWSIIIPRFFDGRLRITLGSKSDRGT